MTEDKLSGWARFTFVVGSILFLWVVVALAIYGAFRIWEKFL